MLLFLQHDVASAPCLCENSTFASSKEPKADEQESEQGTSDSNSSLGLGLFFRELMPQNQLLLIFLVFCPRNSILYMQEVRLSVNKHNLTFVQTYLVLLLQNRPQPVGASSFLSN